MSAKWEDLLDGLTGAAGTLLKTELEKLLGTARNDADEFVRRQGEKAELYMTQLLREEITLQQFQGYVTDIRDLLVMRALKVSVAARAGMQRMAEGVEKHILGELVKFLLSRALGK